MACAFAQPRPERQPEPRRLLDPGQVERQQQTATEVAQRRTRRSRPGRSRAARRCEAAAPRRRRSSPPRPPVIAMKSQEPRSRSPVSDQKQSAARRPRRAHENRREALLGRPVVGYGAEQRARASAMITSAIELMVARRCVAPPSASPAPGHLHEVDRKDGDHDRRLDRRRWPSRTSPRRGAPAGPGPAGRAGMVVALRRRSGRPDDKATFPARHESKTYRRSAGPPSLEPGCGPCSLRSHWR